MYSQGSPCGTFATVPALLDDFLNAHPHIRPHVQRLPGYHRYSFDGVTVQLGVRAGELAVVTAAGDTPLTSWLQAMGCPARGGPGLGRSTSRSPRSPQIDQMLAALWGRRPDLRPLDVRRVPGAINWFSLDGVNMRLYVHRGELWAQAGEEDWPLEEWLSRGMGHGEDDCLESLLEDLFQERPDLFPETFQRLEAQGHFLAGGEEVVLRVVDDCVVAHVPGGYQIFVEWLEQRAQGRPLWHRPRHVAPRPGPEPRAARVVSRSPRRHTLPIETEVDALLAELFAREPHLEPAGFRKHDYRADTYTYGDGRQTISVTSTNNRLLVRVGGGFKSFEAWAEQLLGLEGGRPLAPADAYAGSGRSGPESPPHVTYRRGRSFWH